MAIQKIWIQVHFSASGQICYRWFDFDIKTIEVTQRISGRILIKSENNQLHGTINNVAITLNKIAEKVVKFHR